MGSEGRLWAALAKLLAQGRERSERMADAETSAIDMDDEDSVAGKERSRRETAKVH